MQRDAEGRLVDSANSEGAGASAPSLREQPRERIVAEILPRLERPGQVLGPFVRGLAPDSKSRPLVLWTARNGGKVESFARRLRPVLPSNSVWLSSPSPRLRAELSARHLPLFTRPDLQALSPDSICLLWIEHPLESFDLLRLLASLPPERPRLIAGGPAVESLLPLLTSTCDGVVSGVAIEDILGVLAKGEGFEKALETLSPGLGGRFRPGRGEVDVPWPEELDIHADGRPRSEDRLLEPQDLGRAGLREVEVGEGGRRAEAWLLAASKARREELGIAWGEREDRALADAVAEEFLPLRVHLALGLPPLDGGDVGAAISLLRDLRRALGPDRRLELQLHAYADPAVEESIDLAGIGVWADSIEAGLREAKVRVGRPRAVLSLLWDLARQSDEGSNPLLRHVFALGAGSAHSKLATDLDLWQKSMQEMQLSLSTPSAWPAPRAGSSAEGTHGLEFSAGSPKAAVETKNDDDPDRRRWQRWQALVPQRFDHRIVYRTTGTMKYLSQGELGALVAGLCREGDLPLATTGRVQPKLKMSFGPWLSVGIEGVREYLDLSFKNKVTDLQSRLNAAVPEGLAILDVQEIPPGQPQLALSRVALAVYEVRLSPGETRDRNETDHLLATVEERVSALRRRLERGGETSVEDLHHQLHDVQLSTVDDTAACLAFTLDLLDPAAKRKPHDFLGLLLGDLVEDVRTLPIRRTALYQRDENGGAQQWRTPCEMLARFRQRMRKAEKTCA